VPVVWLTVGGFVLLARAWLGLVTRHPGHYASRRYLALAGDLGITTFGMVMLGDFGASFYPLYLWIIVGNGMRFGARYMYPAVAAGNVAFGLVVLLSEHWQRQRVIGLSLWLGLLILPAFYVSLAGRLHRALVHSEAGRRIQANLARDNARLLDEARAAAAALRDKNAELDAFVHTVSHDLRAPLVSIQGMAELIIEDHAAGLDEDGRHYLRRVQANTHRMERLLLDLLELSRIGREERPAEHVPLGDVVRDVLAELHEQVRARGITVVTGELPTVRAVRVQMEQVVRNLLTNAVKYMGDTPSPTIEIGAIPREAHVECWVRDTGIGIDPRYQDDIFKLFHRLKDVEAEGTGVGLAIVKKIVEAAGGRLWVESAPGQGSTFRFTWPAGDPAAQPMRSARIATASA
jgi:signal transduction histidine kinase